MASAAPVAVGAATASASAAPVAVDGSAVPVAPVAARMFALNAKLALNAMIMLFIAILFASSEKYFSLPSFMIFRPIF